MYLGWIRKDQAPVSAGDDGPGGRTGASIRTGGKRGLIPAAFGNEKGSSQRVAFFKDLDASTPRTGPGGMITGLTQDGKTVDSGVPVQVEWYEYGHNAWMVWGMWRQPLAMHTSDGGGDKCGCSGCRILWRIKMG